MPGKRDEKETDLTVRVLRQIRNEARKTNARLDQTNARLEETNARLDGLQAETHEGFDALREEMHEGFDVLRGEMHEGFDQLGGCIDNLLLGEHRREHDELRGRVERIEQHLGLRSQ